MTKIYTKGGDKGRTSLFSGERVGKDHPLVEAYGTVDELNSVLGVARSLHELDDRLAEILASLQRQLFEAGADLAAGRPAKPRITDERVKQLEAWIDELQADLPPLEHFILPAGHPVAAHLHQARTVCRRAERLAVAAAPQAQFNEAILRYLNRLADLLFVLARQANHAHGAAEEAWSDPGT